MKNNQIKKVAQIATFSLQIENGVDYFNIASIVETNSDIGYAHAIRTKVHFSLSITTFHGVHVTPNSVLPSVVDVSTKAEYLPLERHSIKAFSLAPKRLAKARTPASDLSSKLNH
jgi:hypothetical protein